MANNSDFYNCTTIYMGKYVDSIGEGARYTDDVEIAKHFVEAFALWFDLELFDEKTNWLIIKISYVNDHFFHEELLSAIKFFMQFHDYSYIKSVNELKPIE